MSRPKKPPPRPPVIAKTQNGRDIQKALTANKQDPRQYKDWVVLVDSRMVEWMGTFDIQRVAPIETQIAAFQEGDGVMSPIGNPRVDFGVMLVHKSKLKEFIGDLAERWWHTKLGRRVQQKGPR